MTTSIGEITFGMDVEGALYHHEHGLIPATHFNCPYTRDHRRLLSNEGSMHRDNVLLEFQTPVCNSFGGAVDAAYICSDEIFHHYHNEWDLEARFDLAIWVFEEERLQDVGKEAEEYGCLPDYDARTGERNRAPIGGEMGSTRVASGHIHFGNSVLASMELLKQREFVLACDVLFGPYLPVGVMEETRRRYYGKAGSFRVKPYGIEWRVPSAASLLSISMLESTIVELIIAKANENFLVDRDLVAHAAQRLNAGEAPACQSLESIWVSR